MSTKHTISGLLVITFASAAIARGHYVEVWDPPEARGTAVVKRTTHRTSKSMKRRRAAIRTAPARTRQIVPVAVAPRRSRPSAASDPTFDDIPRKITPEGNVLRVKNAQLHPEVEH